MQGNMGRNPKIMGMQGQIQQNNMMRTFPLPMSIEDAYLQRCIPVLKAVVPENPYYKNSFGTAIFEFVQQLKRDKAPKITGMLIDLNIQEIHNILQNYDHFVMRVEQAN